MLISILRSYAFHWLWLLCIWALPYSLYAQQASSDTIVNTAMVASPDTTKLARPSLLKRIIKSFSDLDTTYIRPNRYDYITMLQNSNTFDNYWMGLIDTKTGESQRVFLHPTPSYRIGPYIGWRWLFLGYMIDVSHFDRATQKSDFVFNIYTASIGIDLIHKRNSRAFTIYPKGYGNWIRPNQRYVFDGMSVSNTTINLYYILNPRKFSYPAAFNQSTQQIKSAGTWKIGVQYSKQKIEIDNSKLPALTADEQQRVNMALKYSTIHYKDYGVNVGYSYNWVFARNCLLAGSLMPTLGIKDVYTQAATNNERHHRVSLNVDATVRVGLVWNNSKYFVGTSLISHIYNYRNSDFHLINAFTTFNVYFGLNFITRKEYRKRKP